MRTEIYDTILFLGATLAAARAVYWVFEKTEDVLSDDALAAIGAQLRTWRPSETIRAWPDGFVLLFDTVFGDRAWSRKRLIRSFIAHTVAVLIVSVALSFHRFSFVVLNPNHFSPPSWWAYLGWVGFVLLASWVPAYVSLIESRWVIGLMRGGLPTRVLLMLLFDLALTSTLFAGYLYLFNILWRGVWFTGGLPEFLTAVRGGLLFWKEDAGSGALFSTFWYSTYLTSAWVWLYGASVLIVRGIWALRQTSTILAKWCDPMKPLRTIGLVTSLLIVLGSLLVMWVSR